MHKQCQFCYEDESPCDCGATSDKKCTGCSLCSEALREKEELDDMYADEERAYMFDDHPADMYTADDLRDIFDDYE